MFGRSPLVRRAILVAGLLVLTGGVWAARARTPTRELTVPRVDALPKVDGELDDPAWQTPIARTGAFLDEHGAPARPYSDARIAWSGDQLVLGLYAGDEDIRSTDAFLVTLGQTTFQVSAKGELSGAPDGTRVGHDLDGTLDDSADKDEEWVLELLVPLRSLGLEGKVGEHVIFRVERCDSQRDGSRRCGVVPEVRLVLGPLR